jgi:hypothetical protein
MTTIGAHSRIGTAPRISFKDSPARMNPARQIHGRKIIGRRWTFSLGALLLFFVFVSWIATFLGPAFEVLCNYREAITISLSPRLTSSGTVEWGGDSYPIAEMRDVFSRSVDRVHADALKASALKARLLITYHSDASGSDVNLLMAIADDIGFDYVETKRLSWPSPAPRSKQDTTRKTQKTP